MMIANKFFETAFHRCRVAKFVSMLLSHFASRAIYDDGLCSSAQKFVLSFQALEEETHEHLDVFFCFFRRFLF